MQQFTFTKGDYKIVISAPNSNYAQEAWEMLQARNYYPTGGKWYTQTDSINPPEVAKFDLYKTTADINTLEQRFVDYCWRLGFKPERVLMNGDGFLVQTNTPVSRDVKLGFTQTFNSDTDSKFWMRLSFTDLHNELITGHNRQTSNGWFRNYEAPKF